MESFLEQIRMICEYYKKPTIEQISDYDKGVHKGRAEGLLIAEGIIIKWLALGGKSQAVAEMMVENVKAENCIVRFAKAIPCRILLAKRGSSMRMQFPVQKHQENEFFNTLKEWNQTGNE